MSQRTKGYLFVILSAVIYGCMPLMVKRIYADGVTPFSVVLYRNLLSLPVVSVLALKQKKSLKIPLRILPEIGILGMLGSCVTPLLLYASYQYMASGTAMVLHFIYPAAVVLGGVLLYREKIGTGNVVSVMICILGMLLFYTPGEPLDWRGCVLAIISGIFYAGYILLLAHFRHQEIAGFLMNFYFFLINSVLLLTFCILTDTLTFPVSTGGWVMCLLMGNVVNVIAVALFQRGTMIIGGEQASVLSALEPATSVFVGVLIFREAMTLRIATGSVLVILAGILIVVFNNKAKTANND